MRWILLALVITVCLAVVEVDGFYRHPFIRYPRIGRTHGRSHARGRSYNRQAHNRGASGAAGGYHHDAGANEYHNIGSHHNKVTKIEKAESSGSHNIGGSSSYHHGGGYGRNYNNYDNGVNANGQSYDNGQQYGSSSYPL